MDYIKEQKEMNISKHFQNRFNPCCDGLYKRTYSMPTDPSPIPSVSILVVMDYIKERLVLFIVFAWTCCFNPCCDGLYKRTRDGR